jgi:hypothetical protein
VANALVSPALSASRPGAVLPLFDPRPAREHRRRFLRDDVSELRHANSFFCPGGRWAARGWVLVRRGDYDLLTDLYRTDFQLQIDDFLTGGLTFPNLAVVQARCVSRGLAADPDALYLVELTDARGLLHNPWAAFPTATLYNVPSPAYPGQFYATSTAGGTPWTWDEMVRDLWEQMGAFLGAYPGLPTTPGGAPEGFFFPGVPALAALARVLDHLGLTLSANPLLEGPYGVVVPGAADAAHAALLARFAGRLEDDLEFIDAGSGRVPGLVTVYFHRRNAFYGTEETVRRDNLQWAAEPFYAVTVPAPAPFDAAAGTGHLWDDFTVRYDVDGSPLAADALTAAAIAAERVGQYFQRITQGTIGYFKQVYAGALPFYAGSQLDGVCWRQTGTPDGAWRTELIRGPQPPWPDLYPAHER